MERLDQGHLHPLLELFEQLNNSYSEHIHELATGEIFLIHKEISKGAGAKSYRGKP